MAREVTAPGPCEHYRKVADNCTSYPDGRIRCSICRYEWDAKLWTEQTLERIRDLLEEQHPGRVFVVDAGAVWLRLNGKDLGIYSKTILGQIVECVDWSTGYTMLSRPTPQ